IAHARWRGGHAGDVRNGYTSSAVLAHGVPAWCERRGVRWRRASVSERGGRRRLARREWQGRGGGSGALACWIRRAVGGGLQRGTSDGERPHGRPDPGERT